MAGSFVENVNLLASKLDIIEESNEIFDEGVIPVLHEIATLDLEEAIIDLKKGNYLGNRKLDINLILNMLGVDEELLERNPDKAEAIWTDVNKAVHYDRAFITFVDGVEIELPFMFDGSPVTVTTHGDLLAQFARLFDIAILTNNKDILSKEQEQFINLYFKEADATMSTKVEQFDKFLGGL